ncbi:Valyl-tRNA synthetase [hydrothermal vent metagenome]|uniref:valine--tRNA ligase n=1 Tax=hydrothermal vent metagenome TaxID=652676 RepID=A0A3B0XNK8_9ZZZZ
MQTTYNPQSIEEKWYQTWENEGYFAPQSRAEADNYCIMIPPPNVTGTLHMGHAFQDTIMDTLTRYHRMKGDNTLWQAGTDHAGIATQMVVERQLAADGQSRHDLGRAAFIDRVWDWKAQSGGKITQQLRRMGGSLDWENERFTMDEGLSDAVHKVFIQLYDEGLIYRGKRLVNWDPVLHTALSDLEVISEEESGHLWHMRYPLSDGSGHMVVATTRPETMLGDSAVAVHPDDERYQHMIGKTITLPLVGRKIPIIADDYVQMGFGTGCVKITPAHDFNDYEMGQRHNLEIINILSINACINDEAPEKYRGFDRYEARDMIIHDLKELDLLEKIDDHKLMVPRGDRSGSVVEPFLTDQWYVKIAPLAEPAINAVKNGDIKFIPENWNKTYYEWMNNIQDWCISRQIWWGHRIPAWYDEEGKVYVADNETQVRKKYNLSDEVALKQDDDVLDTWFSSALWPFSTLGWPENTDRLKQFYPTSVLVTGFDIIFFWVARMIMFGLKFMDEVPFKEIYIHGLVRDSDGQKMSKSKGNVLDPIDIIDGIELEPLVKKRTSGLMQPKMAPKIEKSTRKQFPDGIPAFGTDALRFTFASQATTGRDVVLATDRIAGYRNFCNKIWNATRYVLMNTEDQDNGGDSTDCEYSLADRWIRSRLQQIKANVHRHFDSYRFDLAAQDLYAFVWEDYCDWYLELSKPVLLKEHFSEAEKRGTRQTLLMVLETILRLNHPIMPFITEELWQRIAPMAGIRTDTENCQTIMSQAYPTVTEALIDKAAEEELEWVKTFIMGIRRIRSESDIAPGKLLPVILQNASDADTQQFKDNEAFIMTLAKLESVNFMSNDESAPESSTALVGEMKILIPLAGLIDKDAELARLSKEIGKLEGNCEKSNAKLGNPGFVDKAPEAVVNKERERVAEMQSAISKLKEQFEKISAL